MSTWYLPASRVPGHQVSGQQAATPQTPAAPPRQPGYGAAALALGFGGLLAWFTAMAADIVATGVQPDGGLDASGYPTAGVLVSETAWLLGVLAAVVEGAAGLALGLVGLSLRGNRVLAVIGVVVALLAIGVGLWQAVPYLAEPF